MINSLMISRVMRLMRNDPHLPSPCYQQWWYADVTEKCTCDHSCKYSHMTKKEWEELAENSYKKLCEENIVTSKSNSKAKQL